MARWSPRWACGAALPAVALRRLGGLLPVPVLLASLLAWLLVAPSGLAASRPPEAPSGIGASADCVDDPESNLVVGQGQRGTLPPGGSGQLVLSCRRCCVVFEPVRGTVSWTLQPGGAGVVAADGSFTLARDLAIGTRVKVLGALDLGGGRKRHVESEILVIDPAPQPWAGTWHEVGQLPCRGAPAAPKLDDPIRELELFLDGTFAVTWHPFEVYKDYWGTYTVDRTSGALRLTVTGGNHVPEDLDLDGKWRRGDTGDLVFEEIFLGRPSSAAAAPPTCGHRFQPGAGR